MIEVGYSQEFIRVYEKLSNDVKQEAKEKIVLFKHRANHKSLRVHKLHGKYADYWSFSISYRYRILFQYRGKKKESVILHTIGDHSVYD